MKLFSFIDRKINKKPNWKPVPHSVIKDDALKDILHNEGIIVKPFLDQDQLLQLKELYVEEHNFQDNKGGMFYSVYSQDFDYRRKIHDNIQNIISSSLNNLLEDYRSVINSFIIKVPGPMSEFAIHQDTTGLDEYKYSALNVWIPLEDIDEHNGALCVVKKSHHMFSPYRSISFPTPWAGIVPAIRPYLEPVFAKAGEAIIFDNRLLHNSMPNTSESPRVVALAGIFPQEAKLMTCFKDPDDSNAKIELIEHEDDFLLKYPNFLINCHQRPDVGKTIGWVENDYPPINEKQFHKKCKELGIEKVNRFNQKNELACNMIGEPIHTT